MVRVIPVHNFLEQNVAQIEEPTAACICSGKDVRGELLLLALPSHCVEAHDLTVSDLKLVTVFPVVDLVGQIIHCAKGNYIVTLESKFSRDGTRNSTFVRVYVNWEVQEQRQAMRARIAGRVTPSLNRSQNSLEMIELPLTNSPTAIACCQSTGNLLVASGNTIVLHEFKLESQHPSKLKFIDFEPRPWSLGLHFAPTHLDIVEDFILIMDASRFVVFRLTNPLYDDIDQLSSLTSTNSSSNDKTTVSADLCSLDVMDNCSVVTHVSNEPSSTKQKGIVNQKNIVDKNSNPRKLCGLKMQRNKKNNYIDWDRLINNEREEIQSLAADGIIDFNSHPFTVNLPSITLERAGPGHTRSPFVLNSFDTEVFIKTTSPDNGWSENYMVKDILRLKIAPTNDTGQSDSRDEFFTSFVLKPLYLKTTCNNGSIKKSILRSDKYKHLHGVTCLVCTRQEGYIYHFISENSNDSEPTCLTTYPFTAPVTHVSLEYTVLHALTEAGLESYTMRLPHYVAKTANPIYDSTMICPEVSEPVCLIGLRPFLGIQQLLSSDNNVVLLAKTENSWTLYSLRILNSVHMHIDILNAAANHRSTSPSTYLHLLEEAHTMVRLAKEIAECDVYLDVLFDQSCALLGDYYICSESELERRLCIPYFKMSGLKASEVLDRKSSCNAPGLVMYVTEVLQTIKSGPEADDLFQDHDIVQIISGESDEDLLKLILGSCVLREYATDKLINLLETHEGDNCSQLALALLYIHAEKHEQASAKLEPVSQDFLRQTIISHPNLLFDETSLDTRNHVGLSFSDFATTLMRCKSLAFAEILTQLIEEQMLSLHQVMQVFLEYLPARVGRDGHDAAAALQLFLEIYLQKYFSNVEEKKDVTYDSAFTEAFKILVRSYLGKLMQTKIYKTEEPLMIGNWQDDSYLFENRRHKYLDEMPPCSKNNQIISTTNLEEFSGINTENKTKVIRNEVLKLQALMASGFLPTECLIEIEQFLEAEDIDGSLAFRILCIQDTEAATKILMEKCPRAVLQYAKDKYSKENEWKFLLDLLQEKISATNSSQESKLYFEQTMIETLKYAAEVLHLESLHCNFSRDDDEVYQHFMEVCGQVVHAEHVKSLLIETGRQLLSTLNL